MTHSARLMERIAALGTELPDDIIEDLAARLDETAALDAQAIGDIVSSIHRTAARARVSALLSEWAQARPELSPPALGWALRTASATDAWHRARQSLELVWTGPAPHGTTLRRTDQALLELIRSAEQTIIIVTFAAYRVQDIRDALLTAAERGVAITFVVENPVVSQGKVSFDPTVAMGGELVERSDVYVWPLEQRERDSSGRHGTLHAKSAIADDERILISSANFTGDAMLLNMELGILAEGGELAREVSGHVHTLIREGVLTRWSLET